jgi:hypothetical protein
MWRMRGRKLVEPPPRMEWPYTLMRTRVRGRTLQKDRPAVGRIQCASSNVEACAGSGIGGSVSAEMLPDLAYRPIIEGCK